METDSAETAHRPDAVDVKQPRLGSLDALRGFDMFWIVGGEKLLPALLLAMGLDGAHGAVSGQLRHAAWNGFTAYDLIFPLFLFISGVTMPFSLGRQLENGIAHRTLYLKIAKRALLLVLLGLVYNGLFDLNFSNLRYPSVLGFIGLSWMFAAIVFIHTSWRAQIAWVVGILLGYWAALSWIPVPGYGAGDLSMQGNLLGYIDRTLLPGRLHRGVFDPEGLFAVVSGTSIALMGALAGRMLLGRTSSLEKWRAAGLMVATGLPLIGLALLWDVVLPINKQLWTSSFIVLAVGLSFTLVALFYTIIDVLGHRRWAFPFTLIGLNAITIYLGVRLINFGHTTNFLFGGLSTMIGGEWGGVVWALGLVLIELTFLYILYRKKMFLKV